MHHVHVGQKAKRTYPKVKTTRFKGKSKGKGEGKDSKGKNWKGKDTGSKGKPVQTPRNINNLPEETLEWHEDLCKQVPEEDLRKHRWRYEVFKYLRLVDEDSDSVRTDFCDNAFRHLDELDKRTNHSIVIGPGRNGDSDGKIRLNFKFDPKKTEVSVPKSWKDKGIVKTTYCLVVNRSESRSMGRSWTLLEEQVPLDSFLQKPLAQSMGWQKPLAQNMGWQKPLAQNMG